MGSRGRVQLLQEGDPLTWSPRFVRESGGLLEGVELLGELVMELWRKCRWGYRCSFIWVQGVL